jgi:hypothetical protein
MEIYPTMIKRRFVLVCIILISIGLVTDHLLLQKTNAVQYWNIIPGDSSVSYDLTSSSPTLISVFVKPNKTKHEYHVDVFDVDSGILLWRRNHEADLSFNYIYDSNSSVVIYNPLETSIEIQMTITFNSLQDREGSGYYFVSEENWCWEVSFSSTQSLIIPITNMQEGDYSIKISTYDDDGVVGVYLSKTDPTEENWYEDAFYFGATTYTEREYSIGKDEDWLVIFSLDSKPHDVTIIFTYQGRQISITEIVVIIAFFSALFSLVVVRTKARKSKIRRHYTREERRTKVSKQMILSSQIDIRHEGSRYVYIPPDVLEPDLVKPRTDDYEDTPED